MDIPKIAQLNWTKKWAGTFSILNASYNAEFDINANKKILGEGFYNILFIHKQDITSYYRRKSETDTLGKFLAKKVIKNNKLLADWAQRLEQESKQIKKLLKNPPSLFLNIEKYKIFEKCLRNFHPFLMAVYTVSEYLPNDLFKRYQPVLEKARKYSEFVYSETEKLFKNITKLISKKEGYDTKILLSVYPEEMRTYLKKGNLPLKSELEKRYKLAGFFFKGNQQYVLTGKEFNNLENQISGGRELKINQIKGKTAYPGSVQGTARIVVNPQKIKVFNKGDILITGMTRPDFLFLIKKAGAIVTDAGGILSHAAILARELKKPCITDTEIATKTFRDGDIIKVEATKGIVKKLD